MKDFRGITVHKGNLVVFCVGGRQQNNRLFWGEVLEVEEDRVKVGYMSVNKEHTVWKLSEQVYVA